MVDKRLLVRCPVCDNYSFSKKMFPGSYNICDNCLWEDDAVQYYDPDFPSGANEESLNEARTRWKKLTMKSQP